MTRNNIITGVLLILAGFSIAAHIQQDKEQRRRLIELNNDLQIKLEESQSRLHRSEITRRSLNRTADSLISVIVDNHTELRKRDKKIANLQGKYNHIPVDSLGQIMDERASKWKKGN